ncbi:hypothetical protein EB061_09575, partial [bacterium]|nr:hypothetical protein [bacterium]
MSTGQNGPFIRYSGISPERLLEWVSDSVPFVFDPAFEDALPGRRWLQILRKARDRPPLISDLYGYFELCLSSHFATAGSFVPTDVDLAIREKLWGFVHSEGVLGEMWLRTREIQEWDESPVSNRRVI